MHQGVVHASFRDACLARGLLEDDGEWRQCLHEASVMQTGTRLRYLFAMLLLFCIVMCMARLQAVGQAGPKRRPRVGFGPAQRFFGPEPGRQATAFTCEIYKYYHNRRFSVGDIPGISLDVRKDN